MKYHEALKPSLIDVDTGQADIKIRVLPTIPSDPGPTTTLSPTSQQTSSSSTVTGVSPTKLIASDSENDTNVESV